MASVLELERLIVRLGIDASRYIAGMTAAQNHATALEARIRKLGTSLTVGLTIPLTIMGGVAIQEFKKFDKAMTESLAIMDNVSGRMRKDMEAVAEATSLILPHAPAELAKVYYTLASAGMTAADSMKMMPVVAEFATAGVMDLGNAGDYLVGVFNALHLKTGDVQENFSRFNELANALVATNNLAIGTVEDFAKALENKAGGALSLVNKDLYEGLAVLAAYAQQGVKGALAGSKLEITLRELDFAARDMPEMWDKLRIAVYDAQTEAMLPMHEILRGMEGVLGPMTDKMRRATLEMLGFRARSVQSIIPLLGMSDAIEALEKAIRMMKDEMHETSENQMKSFGNQLTIVTNQIRIFMTDIGRTLAPTILEIGESLKGVIERWKALNISTRESIIGWTALVAAVGPALVMLSLMLPAVRGLIGAFTALYAAIRFVTSGALLSAFTTYVGTFGQLGTVVRVFTAALMGANGQLAQMRALMIGLALTQFVLTIALLAAWYYKAVTAAEKFNDTLKERMRLEQQILKIDQRERQAVLEKSMELKGADQAKYLEEEIERWKQLTVARIEAVKWAQAEVKARQAKTIANRGLFGWKTIIGESGDQIELAKRSLDEARTRADEAQDFVSDLRAQFAKLAPTMGMKREGEAADPYGLRSEIKTEEDLMEYSAKFTQQLQNQIREMELTEQAYGEMEVKVIMLAEAMEGLDHADFEQQMTMAKSIDAMKEKAKQMEKLFDYGKDLNEQIATFGMSDREKKFQEMVAVGASVGQHWGSPQMTRLAEANERLGVMEKEKELMEEGKKIMEEMRTPQEKFMETEKKLTELLSAKAISQDTYNRAIKAATEEMKKANKETEVALHLQKEFPEGLRVGSSRAFDFAMEQRDRINHMNQSTSDALSMRMGIAQSPIMPASMPGVGGAFAPQGRSSLGRNPYESKIEKLMERIEENTRPENQPPPTPIADAGLFGKWGGV